MTLLPRGLQRAEALAWLTGQVGAAMPDLRQARLVAESVALLPVLSNAHVQFRPAAQVAGARQETVHLARQRPIAPPHHASVRPDSFPEHMPFQHSPALEVLELEGGVVAQIGQVPAVFAGDDRTVVADFSSPYAGLLQRYDVDLRAVLGAAQHVRGAAVVLCDDIYPLNFSHWLLDALPRLALLGGRRDVTLLTGAEDRAYKRDSLLLCGFAERRVLRVPDFSAVRAERLLVPRDIADMPHPAFKAAPWALDFLRGQIGLPAVAQHGRSAVGKLFVSRDDGEGRRIQNEAELLRAVEPLGYRRVTLAGRSLAEQAALFAGATHVLGAHGAGLSNCVFSPRGARLLEIFPHSYGTPAFYALMAGQGNGYASYVAADVVAGSRRQTDDIRLDVADFMRRCATLM